MKEAAITAMKAMKTRATIKAMKVVKAMNLFRKLDAEHRQKSPQM